MSEEDEHDADAIAGGQRLDKWLWFARVVKTRTLAAQLIEGGKVRLNRARVDKPSRAVKPGDVVTVTAHHRVRILRVVSPAKRRGPAVEAARLYEELTPALAPPIAGAEDPGIGTQAAETPAATRDAGAGRPTKRDRRQLDRLRGRD